MLPANSQLPLKGFCEMPLDVLIYMKHKKVLNNAKEKKIHKTSLSFRPQKNAPKKEAIKPVANFKLETPSAW